MSFKYIQPCSPVTAKTVPAGDDWQHVIKFDGFRRAIDALEESSSHPMTEEDQDGDDLEGEMFEKFMMHSSRYSRRSLAEQQAAEEQTHKRPLLHSGNCHSGLSPERGMAINAINAKPFSWRPGWRAPRSARPAASE